MDIHSVASVKKINGERGCEEIIKKNQHKKMKSKRQLISAPSALKGWETSGGGVGMKVVVMGGERDNHQ